MTAVQLPDEAAWAAGVAARLRLSQASFADDDAAMRRDYLAEEIDRALQQVPPSQRRVYLTALAQNFPAWGRVSGAETGSMAPSEPRAAAGPEKPALLAAKLAEAAGSLSEAEKLDIARDLIAAGFALQVEAARGEAAPMPMPVPLPSAEGTGPVAVEVPPELQRRLG